MELLEDIVLDLLIHHIDEHERKIILDHYPYIQKKDILRSPKNRMEYYPFKNVIV